MVLFRIPFYILCPCLLFALVGYVLPVKDFSRILDWILDWSSDILTGSAVADQFPRQPLTKKDLGWGAGAEQPLINNPVGTGCASGGPPARR